MKHALAGCITAALLGAVASVVLLLMYLLYEPPLLSASLLAPTRVALDSEFELVVTVSNPHPKPMTLDSIDLYEDFLEGFQVLSITPEPSDSNAYGGMRSWEFGDSISPGDELKIRFELRAVEEGRFKGDLDVCNPKMDYRTLVPDIVVRKEKSGAGAKSGEADDPAAESPDGDASGDEAPAENDVEDESPTEADTPE